MNQINIVYVCGPVTGRKHQETASHFLAAEKRIRDDSNKLIEVVNPIRLCKPDAEWHKAMRICVRWLSMCDGIALLQGWQRSKNATLELKLAQDLRIPVVYVEPPLDYLGLSELFTAAPETLRYYNARLTRFYDEGTEEALAEKRATAELANRYLDPYGFEYIEIHEGE